MLPIVLSIYSVWLSMNWKMATLNEVASKITEIDAKQDKEIAVLTHKVEDLEKLFLNLEIGFVKMRDGLPVLVPSLVLSLQ